jgi:hypothetical protein
MSPETTADRSLPEAVVADTPPGVETTVYEVIGEPPSDPGADQVTVTEPAPAVAAVMIGAPGGAAGFTVRAADAEGPVPTAVVAVTETV